MVSWTNSCKLASARSRAPSPSTCVRVRWLSLHIFDNEDDEMPWLPLSELPLLSSYITRQELYVIKFSASITHFLSCPALQDHKMEKCDLSEVREMESPSLRRLSITDCISFPVWCFCILVSFLLCPWLDIPSADRTP